MVPLIYIYIYAWLCHHSWSHSIGNSLWFHRYVIGCFINRSVCLISVIGHRVTYPMPSKLFWFVLDDVGLVLSFHCMGHYPSFQLLLLHFSSCAEVHSSFHLVAPWHCLPVSLNHSYCCCHHRCISSSGRSCPNTFLLSYCSDSLVHLSHGRRMDHCCIGYMHCLPTTHCLHNIKCSCIYHWWCCWFFMVMCFVYFIMFPPSCGHQYPSCFFSCFHAWGLVHSLLLQLKPLRLCICCLFSSPPIMVLSFIFVSSNSCRCLLELL